MEIEANPGCPEGDEAPSGGDLGRFDAAARGPSGRPGPKKEGSGASWALTPMSHNTPTMEQDLARGRVGPPLHGEPPLGATAPHGRLVKAERGRHVGPRLS